MADTRHQEWRQAMSTDGVQQSLSACTGCGLVIAGGTAGCQAIFDEFLARDFSNPVYFRVHRMMVDVYCLQHPDRYCVSAKSLAAHLTSLCWFIENSGTRAVGNDSLRKWLNGNPGIPKPQVPLHRGRITIAEVRPISDPKEYAQAVERWARSTWEAYAPLHQLARDCISKAIKSHESRRVNEARR